MVRASLLQEPCALHRRNLMRTCVGPIVRINPDEVHLDDPEILDTIFPSAGRRTSKPKVVGKRTGTPNSMVATMDHDMHRRRRNAVNTFFSTASIQRLEPIMQDHISRIDVITIYAFGDSFGFLDEPDLGRPYFEATGLFFELTHIFGHFTCREIRISPNPERIKNTIFEGILNSGLPDEDKTDARLAAEAQLVVFAGEGTTAYTLTAVVDSLPYLNAIINEVVRLHPGVMNRQPRISPDVPIVLPPGTLTTMSPLTTHMNASVFPGPYEFRPLRWIDNPKIARAFLGFSRGSRGCLGMNLAGKEMAMILGTLFRRYELYSGQEGRTLELFDTQRARDIDPHSDYVIPIPAPGSKGLQGRIRA
ncbi:cytochrome P450 [Nemania diffusa]|nr:cytochrome P450 [Nemania diffusa]